MAEKSRFRDDAKQMTDMLFDKRLFVDSLTRDDMNAFEDLIDLLLNSKFESHLRCESFLKAIKNQTNG